MNVELTDIERRAMLLQPFGDGDKGDTARTLRDTIVTARKPTRCFVCFGYIVRGERIRVETAVDNSKVVSTRWCAPCVAAMAQSWEDAGEALEYRYLLGRAARDDGPGDLTEFALQQLVTRAVERGVA